MRFFPLVPSIIAEAAHEVADTLKYKEAIVQAIFSYSNLCAYQYPAKRFTSEQCVISQITMRANIVDINPLKTPYFILDDAVNNNYF